MRLEGSDWVGLDGESSYTPFDLEIGIFPRLVLKLDKKDNPHILMGTGSAPGITRKLLYTFYDGEGWKDLAGSSKGDRGMLPGERYFPRSLALFINDSGNPQIGMDLEKPHYLDPYHSFSAVLRWEDEDRLTVEAFSEDSQYWIEGVTRSTVIFRIRLHNPEETRDVAIYLAMMDTRGNIFYMPDWSTELQCIRVTLPAGYILPWTTIFEGKVPIDTPPINRLGKYYFGAFLFEQNTSELITYSVVDFDVVEEYDFQQSSR